MGYSFAAMPQPVLVSIDAAVRRMRALPKPTAFLEKRKPNFSGK